VDRREFLKRAGVGSAALVSIPALAGTAQATGALQRRYGAVAFSQGPLIGAVQHRIAVNAAGFFIPEAGVVLPNGGGTFVHFDNAPPVPKPIFAFGKWRPTSFVSYELGPPFGTWGTVQASVLEMKVTLFAEFPVGAPPIGATLKLICNIGPAGIMTGQPEGFVLTVPASPFGPLMFVPDVPAAGITTISVPGG